MQHAKVVFWILLVNRIHSLNLSNKTNVHETSSTALSLNFSALLSSSDPVANNITAEETLNSTHAANNNTLCMLNSSEAAERETEFDVIKRIEYYRYLTTRIWRICPPVLLGKK